MGKAYDAAHTQVKLLSKQKSGRQYELAYKRYRFISKNTFLSLLCSGV